MRRGTLTRRLTWRDAEGRRTSVVQRGSSAERTSTWPGLRRSSRPRTGRATSRCRPGWTAGSSTRGSSGTATWTAAISGCSVTAEVDAETVDLQVETTQSRVRVALAARTRLLRDGAVAAVDRRLVEEPGFVAHQLTFELEQGRPATVEKIVALYTSRDRAIAESRHDARLAVAGADDFAGLLARHEGAWRSAWNRFDIAAGQRQRVDRDGPAPAHLPPAADRLAAHRPSGRRRAGPRLDTGRPTGATSSGTSCSSSRSSTSSARRWPATLLEYRYARLGAARAAARADGFAGAMFPWQSGSNGREETQQLHLNPKSGRWLPDHSHLQRHVNIAIAYNVWQHYLVTGSTSFLRFTGAELLIEIARFWSSIATYDPEQDRYEIHGVMGPDEYHEGYPDSDEQGLRNNTYTNVMAVWVLQRAAAGARRAAPALPRGAGRRAGDPRRGAGPVARHHPEDDRRVPRRRRADPVRGLRAAA